VTALALLFPTLLLLVMLAINAAYWYHARSVALAAARDGLSAARLQGSSPAVGVSAATDYARSTGSGVLAGVQASAAGSTATSVCITVRGTAPLMVPLLNVAVSQHACGPVERVTVG
jgi:hypothetical protein